MTRIDDGFFRKRENFFSDAGKKKFAVASREVPATHAVGKEDIAAKELARGGKIQAEAAGAVTRNKEKFGAEPSRGHRPGLFEKLGGPDGPEALG